ncbi:MAG: IS5/IS1182 family transposase, partial [Bryobacteraceae bacterium]
MRGQDRQQQEMFLYASLEELVPPDHPLRPIRAMVDRALAALDDTFDELYGEGGRPSIAPERLLRAQLLMLLYSIRSE